MRTVLLSMLAFLLWVVPAAAQDSDSPHHMLKPDGELDAEKCSVCHEEDLSLSRSKLETCTLCHSLPVHSGAAEHVDVPAANVKQLLSARTEPAPDLPMRDDGGIYCGTCHLFHDPSIEERLPSPWLPPSTGLSETVRQSLQEKWPDLAAKYEEKSAEAHFMTKGTTALRLPIDDGRLCLHCHGGKR